MIIKCVGTARHCDIFIDYHIPISYKIENPKNGEIIVFAEKHRDENMYKVYL